MKKRLLSQLLRRKSDGDRESRRPWRGQSIVEFTLLLPLLLILLSSLIEFGFALNEYLDLIDTGREVARYLSDQSPYLGDPTCDASEFRDDGFYEAGVLELGRTLTRAGWIQLNASEDDMVISVFSLKDNDADGDHDVVCRRPLSYMDSRSDGDCPGANGGNTGWRYFCNDNSRFSNAEVAARVSSISGAPNTGIVAVEIFYDYHMKLGLPWVTGIVGDTITFHTYSFAPNPASEPE